MNRPIWSVAVTFLSVLIFGCATKPSPLGSTHFFASWSGLDADTQPLFEAIDSQMRVQPGFLRDFDDTMRIDIADGVPMSPARMRFQVRLSIDPRMANRKISEAQRTLATFSVVCDPQAPQPCADEIIARARLQPPRIRRIIAHSPPV